jgi:hypothetical protein
MSRLKPNIGLAEYRNPVPTFRQIFMETLYITSENKTRKVFAGFIRPTNTRRMSIPSGPNLPYAEYLRELAISQYVISPDGDHPDCHRHYEAIGMGAIPITELDPILYSHLAEGPVIYNNYKWNISDLEAFLPNQMTKVNRNMVFEEYWMEYVERVVGRPLRWWDVVQKKQCWLAEFANSSSPEEERPPQSSEKNMSPRFSVRKKRREEKRQGRAQDRVQETTRHWGWIERLVSALSSLGQNGKVYSHTVE